MHGFMTSGNMYYGPKKDKADDPTPAIELRSVIPAGLQQRSWRRSGDRSKLAAKVRMRHLLDQ